MSKRIAVIAWGSLIWKPDGFPTAGEWHTDGPALPVEYCRQSDGNYLSLVVVENASVVPTLWAHVDVDDIDVAIEALAKREGTSSDRIGFIAPERSSRHPFESKIRAWAQRHDAEFVVWTALPPKFGGIEDVAPTEREAVNFLRDLTGESRELAEEYIRRSPRQILTAYRRVIESELGGGFIAR